METLQYFGRLHGLRGKEVRALKLNKTKTDDRRQTTDDRRRTTDYRLQTTDDGRRKTETEDKNKDRIFKRKEIGKTWTFRFYNI